MCFLASEMLPSSSNIYFKNNFLPSYVELFYMFKIHNIFLNKAIRRPKTEHRMRKSLGKNSECDK